MIGRNSGVSRYLHEARTTSSGHAPIDMLLRPLQVPAMEKMDVRLHDNLQSIVAGNLSPATQIMFRKMPGRSARTGRNIARSSPTTTWFFFMAYPSYIGSALIKASDERLGLYNSAAMSTHEARSDHDSCKVTDTNRRGRP